MKHRQAPKEGSDPPGRASHRRFGRRRDDGRRRPELIARGQRGDCFRGDCSSGRSRLRIYIGRGPEGGLRSGPGDGARHIYVGLNDHGSALDIIVAGQLLFMWSHTDSEGKMDMDMDMDM
jgi:hypothetical protein